jgi:hypothetical protein
MTFFDCVYLKVSKFYSSAEKEELSGYSGLFVLGTLQMFNVSTFFLIICLIVQEKPSLPSWSFLLVGVISVFANGFRYYKIAFSTLQEKWDGFAERKRKMINRIMTIYIVGSTLIWLFLIIYVGGKKF